MPPIRQVMNGKTRFSKCARMRALDSAPFRISRHDLRSCLDDGGRACPLRRDFVI